MVSHNTTASSVRINSVININDLQLPQAVSDKAVLQSAVFIEDGINSHSIHHRIDPTSLRIYRIYYHRYVRWLLGFVIFVNMMLAFFEYPTSLTLSSDIHYRNLTWRMQELNCGITESIEVICLMCFLFDISFKFFLLGWRTFVRKPWLVLYFVMIVVSFVDIGVSLSFCGLREDSVSLLYTIRVRRYCRPIFFLISSTIMKKFVKAVVLTLPQIFYVLVLLVLHLYVFTMIGLLVFPRPSSINNSTQIYENMSNFSQLNLTQSIPHNLTYSQFSYLEGSEYFSSVTEAFMSLLILLTTANHPDVMMPIYQYNRFSSIYFILFLGIGTFLILNLLIAATYSQFKGFFQKSLQSSFMRRRVAFRAAFTLLARKTQQQQQQQKRNSRLSYVQEVVDRELVRSVLQKAKIPKVQVPQMYQKLETMSTHFLNWQQFKDVFDLVSKEPTKKLQGRRPFYGKIRWLQWVQLLIRHRYFSYITYILSICNVALITIELQISYTNALERPDSRLAYYNLVFTIYYIVEQTLKMIGYGFRGYFRSFGNVYEGILTIILVMLEILLIAYSRGAFSGSGGTLIFHYDMAVRVMNIVIVFRLLRIIAHVKSLRILISIIIDLFKNLSGFAGLMVIIYYLFAIFGMSIFHNVDGESAPDDTTGEPYSKQCGDYDNLDYYANNFHDFAASLVTLWDIMVVNNWFVFLDKFSRDSILKGWSRLYFIVWWLLAAIIGMNLFVSLVLDTFLIKWDAIYGNQDDDDGGPGGDVVDSESWDLVSSREHLVRIVAFLGLGMDWGVHNSYPPPLAGFEMY